MVCNGCLAGGIIASQCLATFSNLEMQHSPKIFCNIRQKVLAKNRLRVSEARKLRLNMIDLEKGIMTIHQSKGNHDRLVYMSDDLCMLCRKYLEILISRYKLESDLFFPASDPEKELQVATIGKRFHKAWEKTPYARKNVIQPTVHSLRHTFVVMRMNDWMESDMKLDTMMPYLSKYLGHTSPDETFYYYHQVEEAFSIIRQKDTAESFVIPEVSDEN